MATTVYERENCGVASRAVSNIDRLPSATLLLHFKKHLNFKVALAKNKIQCFHFAKYWKAR